MIPHHCCTKRVRDPRFAGDPAAKSAPFVFLQMSKSDNLGEKMKEFMQKYDKNADGKIEMAEVSPSILLRATREGPSVACASPMHRSPSRDPSEVVVLKPHHPSQHLG